MALAPDDLIVAPATPPGRGALAVVRLTGAGSLDVAAALAGRTSWTTRAATRAALRLEDGIVEQALVTTFVAPRSFTGQDCVEFSVHGSPVVVDALVRACLRAGARLAEPGEFSLRAFLNGKLDLLQAEAVADLVAATTVPQVRMASAHLEGILSREIVALGDELAAVRALLEASLDFPDEGFHFITPAELLARLRRVHVGCERLLATAESGRRLHEGALVVLAGRPNAGKSSLFNALLRRPRAIVTAVAGTTRDLLLEPMEIGGIPIRVVDTAGLRPSSDPVEAEGVARATEAVASADIVVYVVDGTADETEQAASRAAWSEMTGGGARLLAISKADLWQGRGGPPAWCPPDAVATSVQWGSGLEALEAALASLLGRAPVDGASLTRSRHRALVAACASAVARAIAMAEEGGSEEYVLADLQEALSSLASLRGVETPDEVLRAIFSSFCIGK
ncbi:tRNA modification GTPase MnmE [Luteitalea sp. TBR-22]|uniref:tRNA uridine-5-carboxymethylaminomethyl(34) synthesis GTPase MnmE n=1 Tax=Luteitalea sp. TBR-22 TaxID=2802971 RepID=UPI001AF48C65|nr:tRNA uridine-5-carboxymethylaminomethyl(34) synthesis GTPase MnmE [Luteitalea sp. TBR-22]BCS36122.1 tRNA modification GTPase MnmE [Luteitalea sp. TBR-22]